MWPEILRKIIIVFIPFSLAIWGAMHRKVSENKARVNYGKSMQSVAIANAAFLMVGDYLATGQESMLPFYIGLGMALVTTALFFIVTSHMKVRSRF